MGGFNLTPAVPTARGIQSQVQQQTAPARAPIPQPAPPNVAPAHASITPPQSPNVSQALQVPALMSLIQQIQQAQAQPTLGNAIQNQFSNTGTGSATVRQSGSARSGDAIMGQVVYGGDNSRIRLNTGEAATPRTPRSPREPRTPRSSQDTGREPRTAAPAGSQRASDAEFALASQVRPPGLIVGAPVQFDVLGEPAPEDEYLDFPVPPAGKAQPPQSHLWMDSQGRVFSVALTLDEGRRQGLTPVSRYP